MIEEKDYKFITEEIYSIKKETKDFNCLVYVALYNEHNNTDYSRSIYIEIFDLLNKDSVEGFIKDFIKMHYPLTKSQYLTILIKNI